MTKLRWRLARLIAPSPIVASPGDGEAFVYLRFPNGSAWITAKTLDLKHQNDIRPMNLGSYQPPFHRGTFSGTF